MHNKDYWLTGNWILKKPSEHETVCFVLLVVRDP